MLTNFIAGNGPFIHAVGWTTPTYEVMSAGSASWRSLPAPASFDDGVPRRIGAMSFDAMADDLPMPLMRSSGVPRPKLASRSAVFGGLVAKPLKQAVASAVGGDIDGDRMGVAVVSSSSIVPIFWRFEGTGVADSWDNTDTMLLPASIPSAVGTAASMVTDSHAEALTFGDGAIGMCSAIERVFLAFAHDRADYFLLLGAEEANKPMRDALLMLDDSREIMDGCSGVAFCRYPLAATDWQVCATAWAPIGEKLFIAEPWSTVNRVRISICSGVMAYTSLLLPFALHQAMCDDASTGLVELQVADRGTFMVALRRQGGPLEKQVFA